MKKVIKISIIIYILFAFGLISIAYGQNVSGVTDPASVSGVDDPASVSGVDRPAGGGFINTGYLEMNLGSNYNWDSNTDASFDLIGRSDWSIGFWMQAQAWASSDIVPLVNKVESSTVYFRLDLKNDGNFNVVNNTYQINISAITTGMSLDTWYFIVIRNDYNGGTPTHLVDMEIYINGVEKWSQSSNWGLYLENAGDLAFGYWSYRCFDGYVDELFIYDGLAISTTTIDSLYNSASDPTGMRDPQDYYLSNLVEHVKFDEGTGTEADGELGVITAGTINNASQWVTW